MRTIAHISDVHFGRVDEPVAEALIGELSRRAPTVMVVSGDLTQRARVSQYRAAAQFLARLPVPRIVVPGNHDVPLYNVVRRMAWPLTRYRKLITPDLFPEYQDEALLVLGVNTARSLTWTSGRISSAQLEEIRRRCEGAGPKPYKVLVTHHPFIPSPREPRGDILLGAEAALSTLERCGINLLLAGHLHLAYHDDVRSFHGAARRSVLSIQAGTATSNRRRGEPNAYNWITLNDERVTVEVRSWNGRSFEETSVASYRRASDAWHRLEARSIDGSLNLASAG